MKLTVIWADYNREVEDRIPFTIELIRQLPGPDRLDYWLGRLDAPMSWTEDGKYLAIDHVVVCARWKGANIQPRASDLPINIAYVTDPSQVEGATVDFDKTTFVAIGGANVSDGGPDERPATSQVRAGHLAPAFGIGKPSK